MENNFKIQTTSLNDLDQEPIDQPLEPVQKPRNLKFEPLQIPTLNSQPDV